MNGLRFLDFVECRLEILSSASEESSYCRAIRGCAAPTLEVRSPEKTEKLLTEILGFDVVAEENNRRLFRGGGSNASAEIDLLASEAACGQIAAGTVHLIAFRAADDDQQLRMRAQLGARGLNATPA